MEKTHLDCECAHRKNDKHRSCVPVSMSPPGLGSVYPNTLGQVVGVRNAFLRKDEIQNISAYTLSPEETRLYEDGCWVVGGGGGGGGILAF